MCKSTSTQMIGETIYCSYCGKKAKHNNEINGRVLCDYYFCDCEGLN